MAKKCMESISAILAKLDNQTKKEFLCKFLEVFKKNNACCEKKNIGTYISLDKIPLEDLISIEKYLTTIIHRF